MRLDLATLLLFLGWAGVCLACLTHIAVRWRLSRPAAAPLQEAFPPVTVLRPMKGLDDGLEENLVALFRQDYPAFEIVVGVADADDPALAVLQRVRQRFPSVPVRVCSSSFVLGANPKVNNLHNMQSHAQHELWLISDSNVRPDSDYLRRLVAELQVAGVGLVSNYLVGVGGETIGSQLENLHLNGQILTSGAAAEQLLGRPCVIGKSMLFRRQTLEELGGFRSVADILAEDYVLAEAVRTSGQRVVISNHLLATVNDTWSTRRFCSRHLRWNQLRKCLAPHVFAFEPLLNPTPFLCLAALGTMDGGRGSVFAFALLGLFVKLALDLSLLIRLHPADLRAHTPLLLLLRDWLVLALWGAALFQNSVRWRGHRYQVTAGTRARMLGPVPPKTTSDLESERERVLP